MNNISHSAPKIVFVGTFPPTDEGIATFNEDLVSSTQKLLGKEVSCAVAAINLRDTSPYYFEPKVAWEIDQDSLDTYLNAVNDINKDPDIKCVVIQHEYGIFGGIWGDYITQFMEKLKKPTLTIMHSVLRTGPNQPRKFREVTNKVVENSNAIVVLSKASKETLSELYPEARDSIYFIPHGIHPVKFVLPELVKREMQLSSKIVLTTFGLLSPDKGIEYVLESLPGVIKKFPNILYQVLGQTHPIIRRQQGEKYRKSLVQLTKKLGIRKHVSFVDKYMTLPELLRYLQGTDLYISTSVNPNQAVSGTFSYAVGTGRAVVSTAFVQSKEVVTKNTGRLVPAKDPKSYTAAIIELLRDNMSLRQSHRQAYIKSRSMLWTNVAKNYIHIIKDIVHGPHKILNLPVVDIAYLKRMTKKHGILQFAKYDIPSKEFGYTLDDNARALIVANWLIEEGFNVRETKKLQQVYFNFIKKSQRPLGDFVNYFDIDFKHTDQNAVEAPEEHLGRALWALSETISNKSLSKKTINQAVRMWKMSIDRVPQFQFIRPKAFALKACCILYNNSDFLKDKHWDLIHSLADQLTESYNNYKMQNWHWFEDYISYNNALMPEALVLAYQITKKREYLRTARRTFAFFMRKTFMGEVYVPIGQNGWHKRGKRRALYDQQPEDVCSTVLGLLTMYEVTKNVNYLSSAKHAFTWFLGNNLNGIPLYNHKSGGVYDGLQENGVNKNQGAESLVSYLMARIKIQKYY